VNLGGTIMKKTKVYSTPGCPWCKKVKEYLKSHDIEFENIDVASDSKAGEEMVKKSGQTGVPVTMVGDEIIVGFDEEKLKKVFKIK